MLARNCEIGFTTSQQYGFGQPSRVGAAVLARSQAQRARQMAQLSPSK
jgi:hypothetical protein